MDETGMEEKPVERQRRTGYEEMRNKNLVAKDEDGYEYCRVCGGSVYSFGPHSCGLPSNVEVVGRDIPPEEGA